jgi:hypothetical protein
MRSFSSNKPAAGNAGIASQLTIGHHWPGVPEPGRSAQRNAVVKSTLLLCILSFLAISCGPRDAEFRANVVGSWHVGTNDRNFTITFDPNGTYTWEDPKVRFEGSWSINRGVIIFKGVKSNSIPIHGSTRVRIVSLSEQNMSWDGVTFHR